jgi:phosphoribosyl 1,2-cyclic phosphodiesterase
VRVRLWGVRGSVPVPNPAMARYGGNTACVQVTLDDGTDLVLDAGTGIRALADEVPSDGRDVHVLLTHLHLDHIQGLLFFDRFFDPNCRIGVWGPPAPHTSLRVRLARYLSAPLSPVEIRELPATVSFDSCPGEAWRVGSAEVTAARVHHRGTTLGFRITESDSTFCYLPDHEPALGSRLDEAEAEWISGYQLAQGADLLIHDCQYRDDDYAPHVGWGHSRLTDTLKFAERAGVRDLVLFHHDPSYDDHQLDELADDAARRWSAVNGRGGTVHVGAEGRSFTVADPVRRPATPAALSTPVGQPAVS